MYSGGALDPAKIEAISRLQTQLEEVENEFESSLLDLGVSNSDIVAAREQIAFAQQQAYEKTKNAASQHGYAEFMATRLKEEFKKNISMWYRDIKEAVESQQDSVLFTIIRSGFLLARAFVGNQSGGPASPSQRTTRAYATDFASDATVVAAYKMARDLDNDASAAIRSVEADRAKNAAATGKVGRQEEIVRKRYVDKVGNIKTQISQIEDSAAKESAEGAAGSAMEGARRMVRH